MDLGNTQETELIEKSRRGDLRAFEELIALYEKKVYTIAYRFLGNHTDALDLAQEAFIRIYKALPNYRGEAKFLTWIYQIVANVCKDHLRKQQKEKTISLEEVRGNKKHITSSSVKGPEEKYLQKERQESLQEIINSLPHDFRLVLIMRELQSLTYEEIALQLDLSLGTVKSRLNRARLILRERVINQKELFFENNQLGGRRS
jgi:RNA polymerase sigma-70 factor, ECF subfamily